MGEERKSYRVHGHWGLSELKMRPFNHTPFFYWASLTLTFAMLPPATGLCTLVCFVLNSFPSHLVWINSCLFISSQLMCYFLRDSFADSCQIPYFMVTWYNKLGTYPTYHFAFLWVIIGYLSVQLAWKLHDDRAWVYLCFPWYSGNSCRTYSTVPAR